MEHLQRATDYTESFTWIILSLPRNTQHHHYPHCCIWGNEDTETLDNMTSMWPRSGPNLGTGTPEPVFSDSSILSSGDPAPHLSHVSGSQSDLSRANSTSQQIEVLSYYTLGGLGICTFDKESPVDPPNCPQGPGNRHEVPFHRWGDRGKVRRMTPSRSRRRQRLRAPPALTQPPEPSLSGVAAGPPRGLPAARAEKPGPPARPAPASAPSAPCPEPPFPLPLSSAVAGSPAPLCRGGGESNRRGSAPLCGPKDSG